MRFPRFAFLAFFALITLAAPVQQSPPPTQSPQRDTQAISVIQNALAAMGSGGLGSVQDTVASFQITRTESDGTTTTLTATARTLGTSLYRLDLGDLSSVINQSVAVFKKGSDAAMSFAPRAVSIVGARHIPVLSILSRYDDPNFSILFIGPELQGTSTWQHVQMQKLWSADNLGHDWEPPVDIYIDATSNLLMRLVYSAHLPLHPEINIHTQVDYGDYRPIAGLMIPFAMTEAIGADLQQQYSVQSFAVNQGLHQSDFVLQ